MEFCDIHEISVWLDVECNSEQKNSSWPKMNNEQVTDIS